MAFLASSDFKDPSTGEEVQSKKTLARIAEGWIMALLRIIWLSYMFSG
jgi:hypothetical protein